MTLSSNTPTTTVGGKSRDALLSWLQQNPKTLGWDAIVVYNRSRANALLMQQYIRKLTAENYMTPIDGHIVGEEGSKLHFFGIQLGMPRLSFENADIEKPRARITQPITAGLAILNSEPTGGYKGIHSIMRPNGAAGPTLWMDVDLIKTPGNVTEAGAVQIDISQMKDFDTDLFSDPVSIINAKQFFLARFQEKPELQVYNLGTLSKSMDSPLAPQNFTIRTQAAPGAKNRDAPNYSDGAVILLVTLKDGKDGGAPTSESDFEYLIPNDENGTKYSSAVVISNRVLFSNLIRNHLQQLLPGKTLTPKTPTNSDGTPGHVYLEFTDSAIIKTNYKFVASTFFSYDIITASTPSLELPLDGATFKAIRNTINFLWPNKTINPPMHYYIDYRDQEDNEFDETVEYRINLDVTSTPHADPESGIVYFEQETINDEQIITDARSHYHQNQYRYENDLRNVAKEQFFEFTKNITIPDIDTFLLRNLLFPDSNAMILTDAHTPGDLAIFGNVDPSLTSFVIEPEQAILSPGSAKTFSAAPATRVTWKVSGLPGETNPIGSINDQGIYTAPTLAELQGQNSRQVIITATGTTGRKLAASSSTLVSIVSQTISLNPIFLVAGPAKEYAFTAGAIDERPLSWAMKDPGQGGKVEPATGKSINYTSPPAPSTGMFTLEVLQVTDNQGNMGQAHILVLNKMLGGQAEADLSQAVNGKAKLRFMKQYSEGAVEVPSHLLTWVLLAGPGSIDATGLYTEPQEQLSGFCIITCEFPQKPDFEGAPIPIDYGYIALPLPLSQYRDIGRAYQ
ncbi:hypothetical protein YA0002_06840 [Pseudomonas cichorii]|uniref:hypothetical protein n=1 Tax=Pseudomonas cichorii TaxID=36746 RepID=UPI0018E5BDFB|nr:hypothetical protein [Pseudomonas cichorii]MBI6852477.1 hypothetical protein [Pseudomonas cichorii]